MKPSPQSRVNTPITGCLFRLLVIPPSTPLPHSGQPRTCLLSLQISLHFIEYCIDGIIQYVCFFVCLLSCSIIMLRFIHINTSPFLLLTGIPIAQTWQNSSIHSPIDRHYDFFSKEFVIYYK